MAGSTPAWPSCAGSKTASRFCARHLTASRRYRTRKDACWLQRPPDGPAWWRCPRTFRSGPGQLSIREWVMHFRGCVLPCRCSCVYGCSPAEQRQRLQACARSRQPQFTLDRGKLSGTDPLRSESRASAPRNIRRRRSHLSGAPTPGARSPTRARSVITAPEPYLGVFCPGGA